MADPIVEFKEECSERIRSYRDSDLSHAASAFMKESTDPKYSYNFTWMGRPIIQYPQDMVAIQEIIWKVKPDVIVETGIAHGGSLILSASQLAQLELCEALEKGEKLDPATPKRKVIGVDIDIRSHNRQAIEEHPMANRITMIQGSSIDENIVEEVKSHISEGQKVLVFLDSNHTHEHVYEELKAYAPLTSKDSYCIVFDTIIEELPEGMYPDRPWDVGNNPQTALFQYLEDLKENPILASDGDRLSLEIDQAMDDKLLISVAPKGYLARV